MVDFNGSSETNFLIESKDKDMIQKILIDIMIASGPIVTKLIGEHMKLYNIGNHDLTGVTDIIDGIEYGLEGGILIGMNDKVRITDGELHTDYKTYISGWGTTDQDFHNDHASMQLHEMWLAYRKYPNSHFSTRTIVEGDEEACEWYKDGQTRDLTNSVNLGIELGMKASKHVLGKTGHEGTEDESVLYEISMRYWDSVRELEFEDFPKRPTINISEVLKS